MKNDLLLITALSCMTVGACTKPPRSLRTQDNKAASTQLEIPLPAGMGLLDGSGNMAAAVDPIKTMTTCSSGAISTIPARMIRLTLDQLQNSLKFHAKVDLNASDFSELPKSTTNFVENSYALQADLNFVQMASVAAAKAAAAIDLGTALSCQPASLASNENCKKEFIDKFASRILRTPLTGTVESTSIAKLLDDSIAKSGAEPGLRNVIAALFQHPLFLYRREMGLGANGALDSYELASMLSFTLTDAPADDILWQLAVSGGLNASSMAAQIRRLLADPAVKKKLVSKFYSGYLEVLPSKSLQKDYLPDEEVIQAEDDFFEMVNRSSMDSLFSAKSDNQDERQGIHTHKYYLMNRGRALEYVSEIFAGIALRKDILCQNIAAPKVVNKSPDGIKDAIAQRKQAGDCNSCHQYIDPIGQNYIQFKGDGRFNASSNNNNDAKAVITATMDLDNTYDNLNQLTAALSRSDQVKRCQALQIYRFLMSRPEQSGEECHVSHIYQLVNKSGSKFEDIVEAALTYQGNASRR